MTVMLWEVVTASTLPCQHFSCLHGKTWGHSASPFLLDCSEPFICQIMEGGHQLGSSPGPSGLQGPVEVRASGGTSLARFPLCHPMHSIPTKCPSGLVAQVGTW
jgi:hypothetical protein